MNKKAILILGSVITIFILIIFVLIFIINRPNQDLNNITSNGNNNLVSSPKNNVTSYPNLTITDRKYISSDNNYEYTYPSTWQFRVGREGFGLYPLNDPNYNDGNREILTIFSAPANNQTPEEWSKGYDGYGENYKDPQNIKINGYDVYNMTYVSSYTQVFYIIEHNNLIVHVTFRVKDSNTAVIDNSKYLPDLMKVVNSIKFLN